MTDLRPSTPLDVDTLALLMRPDDEAECAAAAALTPREALMRSRAHSSECLTLILGGEVAGMFGVAPIGASSLLGSPNGVVWALTGRAVPRHPKDFWKASKWMLGHFLESYACLENAVDARYTAALRWVTRLGFTVRPARPYGKAGLLFHPIYIVRSNANG